MDFEKYKFILFERDGRILNVTFNNPEKLNAMAGPAERELSTLFADIAIDPLTDVVVLTGAGRAFSAGGDITNMQRVIDNPAVMYEAITYAKRTVFTLLECPKPIIAKVNGAAAGLGATIALLSDVVFAASHAKFSDPHAKVGFVAGDGGQFIWPFLMGGLAKHYLMTGDPIAAPDAERMGMIFRSLPADELDEAVRSYAQRLASGPRRAIQWTKMSANLTLKHLATLTMDAGMAYEGLSNFTRDHQEAVKAFVEKRQPTFSGD